MWVSIVVGSGAPGTALFLAVVLCLRRWLLFVLEPGCCGPDSIFSTEPANVNVNSLPAISISDFNNSG